MRLHLSEGLAVVLLAAFSLVSGLACGGGGGGGSAAPPQRLPDGDIYLWSETRQAFFDTAFSPEPYVKVDPGLDATFYINEYGNRIPLDILQFGFCQFGEDGYILAVETGVSRRETRARLSVALSPVSINFGAETVAFILEDPLHNAGIVFDIMRMITAGTGFSLLSPSPGGSIVAGGSATRAEKEGMKEYLDEVYEELVARFAEKTGLPPAVIRSQFPRSSMEQYLSGLAYAAGYAGGTVTAFSSFLDGYRDAQIWPRNDYLVELWLDNLAIPAVSSALSESGRPYLKKALPPVPAVVPPVFAPDEIAYADADVRYLAVPQSYWWHEVVRPHQADAGWPAEQTLLTLTLFRDATVHLALDKRLEPPAWLAGWTPTGETVVTSDPDASPMPVWKKEFPTGQVLLPGQGNAACAMYIPFVSSGTFRFVAEVTVRSYAVLMEDDPSSVSSSLPAVKQEGGIVVNAHGITVDPETGFPLIHADFVEEFDANVLLDSETGVEIALDALSPTSFICQNLLRNNGFRLIDTYNDLAPAFGAGSMVVQIENFLGNSLGDEPMRMVLDASQLQVFTNFNMLNSPNLVGIYLKAIATDDPALQGQIWKNEETDRGLNLTVLRDAVNNATGYVFSYSDPNSPVTLKELLKRVGKSEEGEVSFGVRVALASGKTLEMRGGMFCQDYFTNVYDPVLPDTLPLPFRPAAAVSSAIRPSLR